MLQFLQLGFQRGNNNRLASTSCEVIHDTLCYVAPGATDASNATAVICFTRKAQSYTALYAVHLAKDVIG